MVSDGIQYITKQPKEYKNTQYWVSPQFTVILITSFTKQLPIVRINAYKIGLQLHKLPYMFQD